MQNRPKRILLLDDHRLFADGLKSLLLELDSTLLVDLSASAKPLLDNLTSLSVYDLVLTDLQMPTMNGFAFLKAVQTQKIRLRVAVLSGSQSERDIESAMALGACGYIPKDSSGEQMLSAVSKLLNGERYLPDEMFAFTDWVKASSSIPTIDTPVLGARQLEVLSLMRDGMSNPDIANVLGVSLSAIKRHVEKAFKALNVNNRTSCVREAERLKLI